MARYVYIRHITIKNKRMKFTFKSIKKYKYKTILEIIHNNIFQSTKGDTFNIL